MGNNNGSAFAGLTASGTFYATAGGICMFVARYWIIIPVLAIAGSLARKKIVPPSAGTLPTDGPLFVLLLVGTVVLVGALTFVPALALGPIVEHLPARRHAMTRRHATQAARPARCSIRRSSSARSVDAFGKLDPRRMIKNPVMFVVEIGSAFTTLLFVHALVTGAGDAPAGFIARDRGVAVVHRAVRELRRGDGRGPRQGAGRQLAQGAARRARRTGSPSRAATRDVAEVPSSQLRRRRRRARRGRPGDPGDGEIVDGVASVDESAITGESAPVIRESGGDRSAVTGGTRVLSDWLVIKITTAARARRSSIG